MRDGSIVIFHRLIGVTDEFRVRRVGAHEGDAGG